jgi:ribose transport system ATP-binding protein
VTLEAMPVSNLKTSLLKVSGLHKSFADVEVLKGVDLQVESGEIHGLLGANGAGKSTFLGCLSGALKPSKGHILFEGEDHASFTPREALAKGVGIIYQHFQVFEGLTVAENIFVGHELGTRFWIDKSSQIRRTEQILSHLGVSIDPRSPLERLTTGERKIIEIARALNARPKLLILDEPTAALGEREMRALHDVVRQVAHNEGIGVIYVTHLLDEIDEIADNVTVLRNGRNVWTRRKSDLGPGELAKAIAPTSSIDALPVARPAAPGGALVELKDYASPFTGPINIDVKPGEAVGVYGLLGSGRTDLLESLFGARRRRAGEMILRSRPINVRNPSHAMALGISLVASDRADQSLFGSLSATENLLMPHFGRRLLRSILRNVRQETRLFEKIADRLSVHPPKPDLPARHFSGGNAQKIVLGRWLLDEDIAGNLILLDEPTQGVDVGARGQLYRTLRAALQQGAGIIFSSSDPAEIITLADRVLILGYGRQIAFIDNPKSESDLVAIAHRTASAIEAGQ